jgi:hypothetical protein
MSSSSLHAKLISIGAARGYYDFSDDDNPCGTNYSIRYNVMQDYFSNVLGYTYGNQYSFSSYNGESSPSLSDNVRNFAISQVSAGNPVLLSIGKTTGGHVVVAYDYDANTDKLYCHMGWNASTTHSTIESQSYTRYKTALAINFNLSHGHSNNYGVTTIDNDVPTTNFYCYHDCHISTYSNSGIHSYTDHYALHSSQKHKAYCACGEYVLRPHAVEAGSTHTFHGHTYASCVDCGALVDLGTTIVVVEGIDNQDLLITDNGSYVLPNGILIIVEDDLEDYFSGTLSFHRQEDAIV